MRQYRTNDGELISAETNLRLIEKLRALSRDPEPSLWAFMEAMADRVKQQTGLIIETGTEALFVEGLIQAGLIREEGNVK